MISQQEISAGLDIGSVAAKLLLILPRGESRLTAEWPELRHLGSLPDAELWGEQRAVLGEPLACARHFLEALLDPLWMRIGPLVREQTPDRENMLRTADYHDAVLRALIRRDAGAARAAIASDILDGAPAVTGCQLPQTGFEPGPVPGLVPGAGQGGAPGAGLSRR